jgi:hypothetical protein
MKNRTAIIIGAVVAAAVAASGAARGHGTGYTAEENDWFNRQRAVDGTKCCDENDAHVGENVEWRVRGGRYEVFVMGGWHPVPPGRIMRSIADDPSPFGSAALLFYSTHPNWPNGFMLWCFRPGVVW